MVLGDPTEIDLKTQQTKEQFKHRLDELYEVLGGTSRGSKLRMIKEMAEELSKYYNVTLNVKEYKEGELMSKNIKITLGPPTNDIKKYLNFKNW